MSTRDQFVSELIDNRIKNTARTVVVNIINIALASLGPFFIRTLMIYHMGDEYAGVQSLFVSIISLLNMAELGLANAITFFLYEPLAKGDIKKTEQYLYFFIHVYRRIGSAVFLIGLAVMLFLPRFVRNEIPSGVNIYLTFFVYLCATCIQYFVVPELIVLVNAVQKGYISGIIGIVSNVFVYIIQIVAIVIIRSFFFYFVAIFVQSLIMALLRWYVKKNRYGFIHPGGEVDKEEKNEIKKHVYALVGHQMDTVFLSSIDTVIITSVLGLSVAVIYSNYMYVVSAVTMFITTIFSSLTAAIGNAFVTEDREGNHVRFRAVLWLNGILVVWATSVMLCLYQPFMKLWMGERLFGIDMVMMFCILFFVSNIRKTVITFKDANGMWWGDRFKPYVSMLVNLVIDIVLVNLVGVIGALVSSVVCILFIEIPWESLVFYKGYFRTSPGRYYMSIIGFIIYGVLVCAGVFAICDKVVLTDSIGSLVIRVAIVSIVNLSLALIIFYRTEEFKTWKDSVNLFLNKHD